MTDPATTDAGAARVAALNAALAAAQGEFPAVEKNRSVTVRTRGGDSYSYRYATLSAIMAAVRPALAANGLSVVQLVDDGHLVTQLRHADGAVVSGVQSLPPAESLQALGSALTYLRRYAISALLGIAADDDDDGQQGNAPAPTPESRRADAPKWTQRTRGAIFAALDGLQQAYPPPDDDANWEATARRWVKAQYGYDSLSLLTEPQAQALLGVIRERRDRLDVDQAAAEAFVDDHAPPDDPPPDGGEYG